MLHASQTYNYYKNTFKGIPLPFAFIDLDRFDDNVEAIALRAKQKNIRIASKSIRCLALIKRIIKSNLKYKGIMAYSAQEAAWLADNGFDDILIGYPCYHQQDITLVIEKIKQGKLITLMVDLPEHVAQINQIATQHQCIVPLCIDIDMSSNFSVLHFGVFRSNITTAKKALALYKIIKTHSNVKLEGLMGYEAQIAGLNDEMPHQFLMNQLVKVLKNKSLKEIKQRRKVIVEALQNEGATFRFINGGGTGSLEFTTQEASVTEVTAGSGFYSSGLFDHFSNFKHFPAAAYAIEIVRQPKENIFTCLGGGYVASGKMGYDKLPKPFLPKGFTLITNEGVGEVQTPIVYKGDEKLQLGDPIFLRHAKAGELCERFEHLYLISNGKIVDKVKTYRGEGKCFL